MSQTTYRYARLDAHYVRFEDARRMQNTREQRAAMQLMILDCWGLRVGIGEYLERKRQESEARRRAPVSKGLGIDAAEVDGKRQHRCPNCGQNFGSKQARGAHSRYCKKGGKAHDV